MLGYAIGALLYDTLGQWLIRPMAMATMEAFRAAYDKWGAWIILIKGLTPIPYKIVTIASGFAGYNFFYFVVLSLITRGARFFLEAELLAHLWRADQRFHREAADARHHGFCRRRSSAASSSQNTRSDMAEVSDRELAGRLMLISSLLFTARSGRC